jgi:acylphosphatase
VARLHLTVRGKVQGVGFRWFVREVARRSSLSGWVRNLEDGGVEIVVAGTPEALDHLIAAVKQGPPNARVEAVSQRAVPSDAALPSPFTVLR